MNEYWQKLKEWWSGLAQREKQAAAIGASFVLLLLCYEMLLDPLYMSAYHVREQITAKEKLFQFMQAADMTLASFTDLEQDGKQSTTPVELLGKLQAMLKANELSDQVTQLRQGSNDTVELQFQKADFDKIMQFIIALTRQEKVKVAQFSSQASNDPGIVSATLIIKME